MAINVRYGEGGELLRAVAAGAIRQGENAGFAQDLQLINQARERQFQQQQLDLERQRIQAASRQRFQGAPTPRTVQTTRNPVAAAAAQAVQARSTPAYGATAGDGSATMTNAQGEQFTIDSAGTLTGMGPQGAFDPTTRQKFATASDTTTGGTWADFVQPLLNDPSLPDAAKQQIDVLTRLDGLTDNQRRTALDSVLARHKPATTPGLSPSFVIGKQVSQLDRDLRTKESQLQRLQQRSLGEMNIPLDQQDRYMRQWLAHEQSLEQEIAQLRQQRAALLTSDPTGSAGNGPSGDSEDLSSVSTEDLMRQLLGG